METARRPSLVAALRGPWWLPALAVAWGIAEDLAVRVPAPEGVQLLTGAAAAAVLLGRRRAPLLTAWAFITIVALRCAVGAQADVSITPVELFPVVLYSIGRYARRPAEALAGLVVVGAATLSLTFLVAPFTDSGVAERCFLVTMLGVSWGAGRAVWLRWHEQLLAHQDRRELQRTAAAVVHSATLEERARIARELEALVTAAAARIQEATDAAAGALGADARAADGHLEAAQQATREAMQDLRRLLQVLRADHDEEPPAGGGDSLPTLPDPVATR